MTDPTTSNGPTEGEASPQGQAGRGSVSLRLFARTDVGQIREHNEDNFLVADLTRKSRGLLESNRSGPVGAHGSLFAVCDGMGGAAAGEVASQLAVDIIYERMVEGLVEGVPCERDDLARRLVRAVESAGLRIFQEAKMDRTRRGMGTTVTAAALVDDHLFLAQVGDSRGYILRGDTMVQVTRDQSLVNQLIEAGQLTEEEAETFEHNNIILQALGTSDTVQVDLTYVHLRKGDVLLLCSDGLSGMVRFEELKEVLRGSTDTVEICKTLTDRANQAGGHDNITVVVVQFDGEGLKPVDGADEPLKYRKYTLPEPPELTEPTRRHSLHGALLGGPGPASGGIASSPADGAPRSAADPAGVGPASGWHEHGPHSSRAAHAAGEHEDRIDIPGTHVPTWVFAMLVAGVLTLLGVTAFLVLH